MVKKHKPLSSRQKSFAELVVSGRPVGRAYEEAGYKARGASADAASSKLLRKKEVVKYMENLREITRSERVKTALEVKEGLSRLLNEAEGERDYAGYVSLAARLAKMEGFDEPEKHELKEEVRVIIGGKNDAGV